MAKEMVVVGGNRPVSHPPPTALSPLKSSWPLASTIKVGPLVTGRHFVVHITFTLLSHSPPSILHSAPLT
eukprot:Pgem_evm1s2036